MRSGLYLPIFDELADPIVVARLSAEAEEAGWDGVFVWDHLTYKDPVSDVADPWITSAAIATATERVLLGPMVTPLARRRPAMVARETVTLDRLSRGRLVFGVGLGSDNSKELSGTGEELDAKTRGAMLDEHLEVLERMWTGEVVHHRGEHYVVDGVHFRPTAVQQPRVPIWVAVRAGNTKPLRRAARYEGLFPVEVQSPDQLAELVAGVAAARDGGLPPAYDVALAYPPGTDPAGYAEAGCTWWLVGFDWKATSVSEVRSVIKAGPPTA